MADVAKSEGLRNLSEVVGLKSRIGRILTSIRRFAIDSAVLESLSSINAGKKKATRLMQEGVKDRVVCLSLNDNGPGDLKVGLNDIHGIMEQRKEGLNKARQEHERSAKSVIGSGASKKTPNEGPTPLDLPRATEKRLFIRSRL